MGGKRAEYKNKMQLFEEKCIVGKNLNFAAAEAYKLLRTNILFALPDEKKCRVIGVTSSCSGEGKSTTALNLAYMMAEVGEQVLLIESDMRLPTISRRLNLKSTPGLSNILAGLHGLNEVVQKSGIQPKLHIISAGDIPPNPSELLGGKTMPTLMEILKSQFDFVILDLPPIMEVSDALVVSKQVDGMLVVVRQNYANRRALAYTMQQLRYADAKVLGFVMTCSDAQQKGKKYYKYKKGANGYSYGYGYSAASPGGNDGQP